MDKQMDIWDPLYKVDSEESIWKVKKKVRKFS